jgi:hypothetical protein
MAKRQKIRGHYMIHHSSYFIMIMCLAPVLTFFTKQRLELRNK